MSVLSVSGISNMGVRNSTLNLDKAAAVKFGEYYHTGLLDFEAMKNGGDSIQISTLSSVRSKTENLQKMFAHRDFMGMSEKDILAEVNKAYNRELPNFDANVSLNRELYGDMEGQRDELLKSAFGITDDKEFERKLIEIHKSSNGYEGMDNYEIWQKINKDFPDDGTHLSRAKILNERVETGLISKEECRPK